MTQVSQEVIDIGCASRGNDHFLAELGASSGRAGRQEFNASFRGLEWEKTMSLRQYRLTKCLPLVRPRRPCRKTDRPEVNQFRREGRHDFATDEGRLREHPPNHSRRLA